MADNVIKSFEEGAGQSGDILTGGKQKSPLKVGVLTCGYFEYWRMYPTLKEKVEGDLKVVTDRIKKAYPSAIFTGMVDTLDTAAEAGKMLKKEDVDVVLLVYGTYTADFITLTALDYVSEKPLVIFSEQPHANVDKNGDYEGSLRNSAVIGIAQITGTLRKMKRDYKIIVGHIFDERAYKCIDEFLGGAKAVKDLRESNIGIIGHVFRGMYDIELSKTFFKSTFGANIIQIQSSHLLDVWQEVTDSEAEEETKKILARFKTKNVTRVDVFRAMKLAIAMERLAKKFSLDAMCFLDQHFVQRQVLTSARMGASLLMERTGMSVNCEGDLGGLVTMMLMRSITDRPALMGEWGEYDTDENAIFVIGHGIGTPDMAESDDEIYLTRTPEEWGFEGAGCNYELILKPGVCTIAHIMEGPEGYRLLVSKGESIKFPRLAFDELHAVVKVEKPVNEYLEQVFDFGVSHHCIVTLGDAVEELKRVAKILNMKVFEV